MTPRMTLDSGLLAVLSDENFHAIAVVPVRCRFDSRPRASTRRDVRVAVHGVQATPTESVLSTPAAIPATATISGAT